MFQRSKGIGLRVAALFFILTAALVPHLSFAQLSGTYTIGPGGDFASFSDAVDSLHSQGVDSTVVFNVLSGVYRDRITMYEIAGVDSLATITFQSAAGVPDSVVLWDSTTADTNYVVKLDSTDFVAFRDMTFESHGETYASIFHLEDDARHIRIVGNILNSHFTGSQSTNQTAILSQSGLTYSTHDLLIEGNVINGATYGIDLSGRGWSVYFDDSTQIVGNTLNIMAVGIDLDSHHAPLVEGNEVYETSITGRGIRLRECSGALRVLRNRVYFRSYGGIEIAHCGGTAGERGLIANNFVRNTGPSASYLRGIQVNGDSPHQDVFHNTVIFESVSSYGVFLATHGGHGASNVRVMNNNFICLDAVETYDVDTPSMITVSDFNNIYNASNTLAYWGGESCPNLDSLRTVSGQDSNSVSVYPMFPDLNEPYTTHPWLDGAGAPLTEVTVDIDGNPRDPTHPDIGCCEFASPPGSTPYSGTLTIGTGGDFPSFTEAIDSLGFRGISGPVVVNVLPGDYDEELKIRSIPGTSWQDTLVFRSSTGNPEDVTLHHTPSGADDNHTIHVYGADHLCFEAMTLFSDTTAGAPYRRVVDFFGEAENIRFRSNRIYGPPYHTLGGSSYNYLIRMEDSYATRRVLMDNYFEGGREPAVSASGGGQTGLVINGNSFVRLRKPLSLGGIPAPQVIGNMMTEIYPSGGYAVFLRQCDGPIRFERNQIYISGGSCLAMNDCNGSADERGLIANNFVRAGGGTGTKRGVHLEYSSYQDVYYNSVNITGSSAETHGRCIYDHGTNSNLQVVNNILCNSCDGYCYYVEAAGGIITSDHNDIYTTGPHVARWGGVDITDLDSLIAVSGTDSSSVSADPGYISDFDLHATSAEIDSMATPLAEVVDDIDVEARDPNYPDIGADEFTAGLNYPPVITSEPDTLAYEDSLYQYQVIATDQNGDTLIYRLSVAPSWMTIDDSTGLVEGTPTQNDVGDTTVTVVVDDGHGGVVDQTYPLHVLPVDRVESSDIRAPEEFWLSQACPNPAPYGAEIRFSLPEGAYVTLEVYNTAGQKIATLLDERFKAGQHAVGWQGCSSDGRQLPRGLYFYRLEAVADPNGSAERRTKTYTATGKMVLMR